LTAVFRFYLADNYHRYAHRPALDSDHPVCHQLWEQMYVKIPALSKQIKAQESYVHKIMFLLINKTFSRNNINNIYSGIMLPVSDKYGFLPAQWYKKVSSPVIISRPDGLIKIQGHKINLNRIGPYKNGVSQQVVTAYWLAYT
jgi:hypothetical protein